MIPRMLCYLLLAIALLPATIQAADQRLPVTSLLSQEIIIEDNFAGQSITLLNENGRYIILRQIFGSGVPVIEAMKYTVTFNSDFQLSFNTSNLIFSAPHHEFQLPFAKHNPTPPAETFILRMEKHGFSLYLNGVKVQAACKTVVENNGNNSP